MEVLPVPGGPCNKSIPTSLVVISFMAFIWDTLNCELNLLCKTYNFNFKEMKNCYK